MPRDKPSIYGREEKSSKGGIIAVLIVVVLIGGVIFAIMSGGPPELSDAENVFAQAGLAVEDVKKESFTLEGGIEANTEAGYLEVPVTGEGRLDTDNKRMYLKLNMESPTSGNDLSLETYAIGDEIYTNFEGEWIKYESEGMLWGDAQLSKKLIEFADNFNVSLNEKEEVNGQKAYKVVISPTIEELINLIATIDPGMLDRIGKTNLEGAGEGLKDITMTLWIDEEKFLPARAKMEITGETTTINPGGSGVIGAEVLMSLTINFDRKTPFDIVLPSAASDAAEI